MTSSTIPIPKGLSEAPGDVLQAMTRAYGALPEKRCDEARQGFEAALALAEAQGSRWGAILAKHQLANVMFNLRRDAESGRLHDEVLAEGRALDSVWIVASSLGNIGNVDAVDGRGRPEP